MTSHRHAWHPVDGHAGGYGCSCGAYGQRPPRGGEIRRLNRRPTWAAPVTARPAVLGARSVAFRPLRIGQPAQTVAMARRTRRAPGCP